MKNLSALKKGCCVIAVALFSIGWAQSNQSAATSQKWDANYSGNNCVSCHAQITQPVGLSNRYFEWHSSEHKEVGVSCEKCHGGDPTTTDKAKAHSGIAPYSDPKSKIHFRNLPETCKSCHQGIVNTFVESKHYQNLKVSGLGPSCSNCHAHMASEVMLSPQQTSTLCAYCHDTVNGALPPRPDIREKAEAIMQSLNRADVAVRWAASLLREAEMKRMSIGPERMQVNAAQGLLKDAKFSWHSFSLEATQKKADEAFSLTMKAKEDLGKKINH